MIRKVMLIYVLTLIFATAYAHRDEPSAIIKFMRTEHDYGEIEQNSDGMCEFKFKNMGDEPLILSNLRSSCGCTVPEWPKDPIKKAKEGIIKVKYNTRIVGAFSKTIVVYSNGSEEPVYLKIKGVVTKTN